MRMKKFNKFQKNYQSDSLPENARITLSETEQIRYIGYKPNGYAEFLTNVAQSSFEKGLIRFLLPQESLFPSLYTWNSSNGWIDSWKGYQKRLFVFAYDWLGRQISFDRERIISGEPMIAILEPGTGELLEVPVNFMEFIEKELIEYPDAALASDFYKIWLSGGGDIPTPEKCIGYKIPLFLGGTDTVDNLEIVDINIYVQICGYLFHEVLALKPGQKISEISLGD